MNTNTAISALQRFGWSVYPHPSQLWKVYTPRGSFNSFYTSRELIHLANSLRSNRWHKNHTEKTHVGPGGINCPCCTKGSKAEMKKWERKAIRREGKKVLDID